MDAELARQSGDLAVGTTTIDRSAWAADLGAAYAIDYKWSPKVGARYSYRSGQKQQGNDADDDTTNGLGANASKYKAWDTMFEDQTHGIIANRIFNGNNDGVDSNSQIINVMASAVPLQDLTVSADYYYFMLAQKWTNLDDTTRVLFDATGVEVRDSKNLGQELDLSLAYDYTEDVQLGLTMGCFAPGDAFPGQKGGGRVLQDSKGSPGGKVGSK